MIIAVLFGSLVTLLTHGTANMADCKALEFKPSACKPSKVLDAVK
jgi:hypothetical protein